MYRANNESTKVEYVQLECSSIISKVWDIYKDFVKRHYAPLELGEDIISKILFWIPHQSSSSLTVNDNENNNGGENIPMGEVWREICYGLLSLQRLGMDLAIHHDKSSSSSSNNKSAASNESYGMTIQTLHPPRIPATQIRIMLTIMQSIMPSLLAIAQSKAAFSSEGANREERMRQMKQSTTSVRLYAELVKFVLRIYLMWNYWKQQLDADNTICDGDSSSMNPSIGIMIDGGMYQVHKPAATLGLSWSQTVALERRQRYVGRRTGWRMAISSFGRTRRETGASSLCVYLERTKKQRTMVADLLNSFRPLLWAWFESRYVPTATRVRHSLVEAQHPSFLSNWSSTQRQFFRAWCYCLAMDLASIHLLENGSDLILHRYRNPATEEEIRQRKLRLLLYALRPPVWNIGTSPLLEQLSQRILRKIPLLGTIAETLLMDWILYYKHPFISEER